MTTHIDSFGREWRYTPDHDTSRMVKVPSDLMRALYKFGTVLSTCDAGYVGAYADGWPTHDADCYFLKSNMERDFWYAGVRYGDDGAEYLSLHIPQALIIETIKSLRACTNRRNWEAIVSLTDVELTD